jgi:hypothetical protein
VPAAHGWHGGAAADAGIAVAPPATVAAADNIRSQSSVLCLETSFSLMA